MVASLEEAIIRFERRGEDESKQTIDRLRLMQRDILTLLERLDDSRARD
jgi:hypothetical protein